MCFVVVCLQPMIADSDFIAVETNSCAASECISNGHPLRVTISYSMLCAVTAAVLPLVATSTNELVARSMIPNMLLTSV